ncbi:MAG: hypothetical protein JXR90_00820 [Spirochaetes bacterium]|nr:hypothetical protein [Spirochaetota bacterium]
MAKVYCEFCGKDYPDIRSLTQNDCGRHPAGAYKGKHKLYEGSEKSKYFCKYCGKNYSDIASLTQNDCGSHPDGAYKGKHAPAL